MYRMYTDNTSARRSMMLYLKVMVLSFHAVFSLVNAAVVCAALERISDLERLSHFYLASIVKNRHY